MNTESQNEKAENQAAVSVSVADLRIGNYYSYDDDTIKLDGSLLATYLQNDCDLYLYPILLIEDWHNKFGVKKNGFNSFEYKLKNQFNLYLTVIFTGDCVMIRQGEKKSIDNDMISVWNKDLTKRDMYVHEWQNLYFSLSGSDLTERGLTEH